MSAPIWSLSARDLAASVRAGTHRAREVVDAFLQRIAAHDAKIGAFVEVWSEAARAAADAVDARRERGESLGPLAGVPVAIKDNFLRQGRGSTCGSQILEGFVAPYTATAVERLEAADAVLIGRTNMDEFGMGSSTEHSAHGTTRNPFDLERVPGGSSGGSAAAVAARLCPLALGSDTGGSVRQPAALCGVPGFKPTYGRIPRWGLVSYASSLDHVAAFGRTVGDLALATEVMAGPDGRDATALATAPPDLIDATERDIAGLRVGVAASMFDRGVDAVVVDRTRAAVAQLEELGATTVPVELTNARWAIPAYYLIATSEASSNLARYDGVRYGRRAGGDGTLEQLYVQTRTEGLGPEVKLRILLGTFCLLSGTYDEHYLKATKVRTLIRADFDRAFEACDVLAMPVSPTAAFPLGSRLSDPLQMYAVDTLTTPASLAGIPALSVPCGFTDEGLPIGLQLIGRALDEATVLRAGTALERATGHSAAVPKAVREAP